MIYDVHAHCIPEAVIDTLRRDGGRYGIEIVDQKGAARIGIAGRLEVGPVRTELLDFEARLAAMDAAGVDVQLVSSWIDATAYALDEKAGSRYARLFNEGLAEIASRHPGRFVPLCTVPLQAGDAAANELRHAVATLGMAGVEIATTVDGAELDDPGLDPFWAAAEELRCLVLVHPYNALAGRGVQRYFLENMVARPAETTIAMAHLIFGGVLERFPELQVCVVHGGGFLPYQFGRLERGYAAKSELTARNLTRSPREWLQAMYYDTVLHSPEALGFLVSLVGADHVVLGTDYPFEMGDPDPRATIEAIPGLGAADRELIMGGTVQRLLDGVRR